MDLARPLAVVTPTLDADILEVLARADHSFSGREVQRQIVHASEAGVRRALARLVRQGIVVVMQAGSAKLYRLNREHLAAGPVVALAGLRDELVERLRRGLAAWKPRPTYAALFGSAARGDGDIGSDIDVFLVRPVSADDAYARWSEQVDALAGSVNRWTGNDVRILEYGVDELRRRRNEPVLASVEAEGIALVGTPAVLRRRARP